MKKVIWSASLLLMLAYGAEAQTSKQSGAKKQQASHNKSITYKTPNRKKLSYKNNQQASNSHVLNSTGTYRALGNSNIQAEQLQISDPVIRTLNARAATPEKADLPGSGIIGMPKLSYGIANGHILFRPTDAPTLGTSTGSGSVGTGTNVGPVGTAGNALGVNGKNPYAGPGIYGLPINDENFADAIIQRTKQKDARRKGQ